MAFFSYKLTGRSRFLLLVSFLCGGVLFVAASGYGYSQDYEGYLGETIALNGVSYNSDQIYLFMTGPGLPENGVTLTDTSQQADQGSFTTVGVDSSQQWSYKWDTSKLENQIDPGTYTVYAVNSPADKSNLAGSSYQTLTVYLKDGKRSRDRVNVGTTYTLNLADDDPDVTYTVRTVPPTPISTTIVPVTTKTTVEPIATSTTKKSPELPFIAVFAVIAGCTGIFRQSHT